MLVETIEVRSILTRTRGYLAGVASHSLQPYAGCGFGKSLCGVGCYAQHNRWITRGRAWGEFLDVRVNAPEQYLAQFERERQWARRQPLGQFLLFCSSSTDPFVPQEARYRITERLLDAMLQRPPDGLILQTHSHRVADQADRLLDLAAACDLRVQISIETDRERLDDLPPHASPVARRIAALGILRQRGIRTVATVAPLLPIADPERFFSQLAQVADAVLIDHFIEGDGTTNGCRTQRTRLPERIEAIHPGSASLAYREEMVAVAQRHFPGRVGVGPEGFAGRFLDTDLHSV